MPDPNNPFLNNAVANTEGGATIPNPIHPHAPGLSGEMLDAIVQAAWSEGREAGLVENRERELRAAREMLPKVHDNGFDAGAVALGKRLAGVLGYYLPRIDKIVAELEEAPRLSSRLRDGVEALGEYPGDIRRDLSRELHTLTGQGTPGGVDFAADEVVVEP